MGDPPGADGGGGFSAPPPASGLGNFKGVMLCSRPPDNGPVGGDSAGQAPFKPTISATVNEQLGLPPPIGRQFERRDVKTRGPSAALRQHVQWLRDLQGQVREERQRAKDDVEDREQRKLRTQEMHTKQRQAVRELKAAKGDDVDPRELEEIMRPGPKGGSEARKRGAEPSKPLWAMTADEKDSAEDAEADDLIDFAANLDYEKYVGDLEFRQHLAALKDHAGRVARDQNSFKDALLRDFNAAAADDDERSTSAGGWEEGMEGQSLLGDLLAPSEGSGRRKSAHSRPRGGSQMDWDNSTACGEDRNELKLDAHTKAAAERVLESNSQVRAVHSKASVQRLVDKIARETTPCASGAS